MNICTNLIHFPCFFPCLPTKIGLLALALIATFLAYHNEASFNILLWIGELALVSNLSKVPSRFFVDYTCSSFTAYWLSWF